MSRSPLRIGTRGSPLALVQARETAARLTALAGAESRDIPQAELTVIRTTGDRVTDRPLAAIGGKGLFTKELDEALRAGAVDCAVHSMKDVPTWLPDEIVIAAVLAREDHRDAWIGHNGRTIDDLPAGARIGSSSLRRQAQIMHRRSDVEVVLLRGNVGTRLDKVESGDIDATILAMAGLRRLGFADGDAARRHAPMSEEVMLPAAAQGAIAITCRADDRATFDLLARISCPESLARVTAERAMLDVLGGTCDTPIGGLATIDGDQIHLKGLLATADGRVMIREDASGARSDPDSLGRRVGAALRSRAEPGMLPT